MCTCATNHWARAIHNVFIPKTSHLKLDENRIRMLLFFCCWANNKNIRKKKEKNQLPFLAISIALQYVCVFLPVGLWWAAVPLQDYHFHEPDRGPSLLSSPKTYTQLRTMHIFTQLNVSFLLHANLENHVPQDMVYNNCGQCRYSPVWHSRSCAYYWGTSLSLWAFLQFNAIQVYQSTLFLL